jgi:hypothetical protein
MPFKGEVSTDDKLQITFHASPENQGSSSLLTGYVPDGVHPPAPSEFDMVAPGGVANHHTRVRPAFGLKITVDVPVGGRGELAVFANGALLDREEVEDTIWTYGIV